MKRVHKDNGQTRYTHNWWVFMKTLFVMSMWMFGWLLGKNIWCVTLY